MSDSFNRSVYISTVMSDSFNRSVYISTVMSDSFNRSVYISTAMSDSFNRSVYISTVMSNSFNRSVYISSLSSTQPFSPTPTLSFNLFTNRRPLPYLYPISSTTLTHPPSQHTLGPTKIAQCDAASYTTARFVSHKL